MSCISQVAKHHSEVNEATCIEGLLEKTRTCPLPAMPAYLTLHDGCLNATKSPFRDDIMHATNLEQRYLSFSGHGQSYVATGAACQAGHGT